MRFSIVTPSFRNSEWLKLCVASVADQRIEHEHIVQDSCSDDGTQDWLPHDKRVQAFVEKDRGMYDAVNRGFERARGELLAYINCDEQYLPGALAKVSAFFDAHPEVDVVFADAVVVNADGTYVCDRSALVPQKAHTIVGASLSFLTCSMFMRRSVFHERGVKFDPSWRDYGDAVWALRLIDSGVRMATMREITTAFTETGTNMNLLPNAAREKQQLVDAAPAWMRAAKPLVNAHFRLRKLLSGSYTRQPYEYSIFTKNSPAHRQGFEVSQPTFRWIRSRVGARTVASART